jgi:hypothetical protein
MQQEIETWFFTDLLRDLSGLAQINSSDLYYRGFRFEIRSGTDRPDRSSYFLLTPAGKYLYVFH